MRRPLTFAVMAIGFAALPVTYSPDGGLQANRACADGNCCPEAGSVCGLNGQNYSDKYWTNQPGPCPKVIDPGGGGGEEEILN